MTDIKDNEVLLGEGGASPAGWHSISSFMRCPKAYQLEMVRGVTCPQGESPSHFTVGILFHAMRAQWFALNFASDEAAWGKVRDAAAKETERSKLVMQHEDEQYAIKLMSLYMDHWLRRPRPTPKAAEYLLGPAPLQQGDAFNMFRTARLDDLSCYPEAGGALCIGEAKTTSGDVSDVVREYELHGQPMLQAALYQSCPNGEQRFGKINGVMLDVCVKPDKKGRGSKFARVFVEIRPEALQWYVQSMRAWITAMNKIDWNTECPRNPHGCTYMAGRMRVNCPFKDLCRFGPSAAAKYVMRDGSSLKAFRPDGEREKFPWE